MMKYFLTIIITAAVVGGMIFGWQQMQIESQKDGSTEKIEELEERILQLIEEKASLETLLEEKERELEEMKTTEESQARMDIFGERAFESSVTGYLVQKEEELFGNAQTNAYLLITEFSDDELKEIIKSGVDRGNSVNQIEGEDYLFNLGCIEDGKISGAEYDENKPYLDDETQKALLESSEDELVTLTLSFGLHEGKGCACCNLAHSIRVKE